MAQNIYDDETFFAGYAQLPRSVEGLDGAPEWPSMRSLLPDMRARRVLDLGCGYGWFCRWASEQGAGAIHGIDLSARMLERATAATEDTRITYEQADLEDFEPGHEPYDLVYSSLTVHYLIDLHRFADTVHRALRPGGSFVFSVEHPIFTAPSHPAFASGPAGSLVWPLDDYLREGRRVTDWLAPGVVKQHRTVATYVTALVRAGFRLTDLVEWGPSPAQIAAVPAWQVECDRPPFMFVGAVT